eukprot:PITA_15668
MLAVGIIELVEESNCVSPIVVQEKKKKEEIRIYVDLRKLNDACMHDPFPSPFTDEVLDNVSGQEAYSFTDEFFGYHQIKIAPEDRRRLNVGSNHLSRIEVGEPTNLDEGLPNTQLFVVCIVDNHFEDIIHFPMIGTALEGYMSQQKKELVVHAINFSIITGHLYKMGSDEILQCYVPEFERNNILTEAHDGAIGGHYAGKATTQKILRARL